MYGVKKPKVIVIVGPTASGKTALSVELAKLFNGEIISSDSRQVYRGMNLGTGKVTITEMQGVPHHLLDITDPNTIYTGADFKRDGGAALTNIIYRDKLPIIAGGTFFYLELLRGTITTAPVSPNYELRTTLESKSTDELKRILHTHDVTNSAITTDTTNRRRLIRAIEIVVTVGAIPPTATIESPYDWLMIGIDVPTNILRERIQRRIIERLDQGMIEEIQTLHDNGVTWERLDSFGLEYRYISQYLQNLLTREQMIDILATKTRQFAKRQRTWLKRDKTIQWFPFPTKIDTIQPTAQRFLNN